MCGLARRRSGRHAGCVCHRPRAARTRNQVARFSARAVRVIGLETAAGVTYSLMVGVEHMPLLDWVARWTTGPAAILGLPPPTLTEGQPADLALFDVKNPWRVDPENFQSLSRNCPFANWTLHGRAMLTICAGK